MQILSYKIYSQCVILYSINVNKQAVTQKPNLEGIGTS